MDRRGQISTSRVLVRGHAKVGLTQSNEAHYVEDSIGMEMLDL